MKKQLLCGALTLALAMGALFPLSACGETGTGNGGQGNYGTQNNGNGQGSGTVAPGTVITDEATKNAILDAVATAEWKGIVYSGTVDLSLTAGETVYTQKFSLEGAARTDDFSADVCVTTHAESGEETAAQYFLIFLRGDEMYLDSADWDGKTLNFSALKTALKDKEDPLVLEKEDVSELRSALSSPAAGKIVKNLTSFCSGTLTKTEGGYSFGFDLLDAADSFLKGAKGLAAEIDENPSMTLSALLARPFAADTLSKLLKGATAKEVKDGLTRLFPGLADSLPEAGEKTDAKSYLESCLRSGGFFTAVTGGDETWGDYKTFAEVPLDVLMRNLFGTELEELHLEELLDSVKLKEGLVAVLGDLLSLEGELSDADLSFKADLAFDEDKKLLGFSLDGAAKGSFTSPQEAEEGGAEPPAAPEKNLFKAGMKLSATLSSAPALFELKGCKYYGEEGSPVTIA